MKIIHIVNNYGMTYDGIGAYAAVIDKYMSENVQVIPYSSNSKKNSSKIFRIFDFGMTNKIWSSFFSFKKDNADIYLLEYPFMDWNPLFLIPTLFLKIRIAKNRKHLALSLHEYDRVNFLRKVVIRALCLFSDVIFVSDARMQSRIRHNKRTFIRSIPTNIYNKDVLHFDVSQKEKNHYAFFGLVSASKAFDEMIKAWDMFNNDGSKRLDVITSSNIVGLEKHHNVKHIYNADNDTILDTLKQAAFSIVPIRPEVDEKNTSFKTSSLAGCICIGKFCKEYACKKFVINMENYSIEEFVRCFRQTEDMCLNSLNELYKDSHSFSLNFLPDNIAKAIESFLKEVA